MAVNLYSNCDEIGVGCGLYTTSTLRTPVPLGKYSDGTFCYTVNSDGLVTLVENCGITTTSTTTTTTAGPCVVWYIERCRTATGCIVDYTNCNGEDVSLSFPYQAGSIPPQLSICLLGGTVPRYNTGFFNFFESGTNTSYPNIPFETCSIATTTTTSTTSTTSTTTTSTTSTTSTTTTTIAPQYHINTTINVTATGYIRWTNISGDTVDTLISSLGTYTITDCILFGSIRAAVPLANLANWNNVVWGPSCNGGTTTSTTTTLAPTTAELLWNFFEVNEANGEMILYINGNVVENRFNTSSGTINVNDGDTINCEIIVNGCPVSANAYCIGIINDASCANGSTSLFTNTYQVASGDVGNTIILSMYAACDSGCV
jgi:hypothetical protein